MDFDICQSRRHVTSPEAVMSLDRAAFAVKKERERERDVGIFCLFIFEITFSISPMIYFLNVHLLMTHHSANRVKCLLGAWAMLLLKNGF